MAFSVGYNADVQINNISLCATKFTVNTKVDEIDITNFCSSGFVQYIPGAADADITIEGILGTNATTAVEDPAAILALRDLGDIRIGSNAVIEIYPNSVAAPGQGWIFGSALITGWNMEGSPRDTVRYTIMAKSNGLYTEPEIST